MKSRCEKKFWKQFEKLPPEIQAASREAFRAWKRNPHDPSLENHPLADSKKGRHRNGSHAVSITRNYRSIYVIERDKKGNDVAVWYWTGSHEDYNSFIASKRA